MKEIFQKFFDEHVGAKSYNAIKYDLQDSYANSILVEVTSGGSSGGDCYGGYTSRYDKDNYEMKSELSDDISYKLRFLCEHLGVNQDKLNKAVYETASDLVYNHSSITDTQEGGDYYGNHTNYCLYEVNILNFLENLVSANTFSELQNFASSYKEHADIELEAKKIKEHELTLLNLVENFAKKSDEEKEKLKTDLANYKNKVIHTENLLAGFDLKMSKDKKDLEKKLADVQALTGTSKISSPEKSAKKKM